MKKLMKVLEGIMKMVKLTVRRIVTWEPLINVARKRASRKVLVEYSMQKGAVELDGSGYKVLKLERPEGSSSNGYRILVDDILVCTIDDKNGKVRFTENAIRNYYELIEHIRQVLRNLSRGGFKLNDSFREYFETKDMNDSKYDRSYESNIDTHLCSVGWQIF